MHGRERTLAELLPGDGSDASERLAAHLHARQRLTPTLLLRALCTGDLGFFDCGMARLAGIPVANARTLLYDRGVGGLRAIYREAELPPTLFRAFRIAVSAVLEGQLELGRAGFTQHIIDQLTFLYDDVCPAGLEHVLAQLARLALPSGDTAPELPP